MEILHDVSSLLKSDECADIRDAIKSNLNKIDDKVCYMLKKEFETLPKSTKIAHYQTIKALVCNTQIDCQHFQ